MEPLTPKEVNELRRLDPSMLYADEVRGLLATVDALAAALREVVAAMEDCPDPDGCNCGTAMWLRGGTRTAVDAWLEDGDE